MLFAAAAAGALLAVAFFSFTVSRSSLVPFSDTDQLQQMARSPRLTACGDYGVTGRRLQTSTTATRAGTTQRVELTDEDGCLGPDYIAVEAGVPVELHFATERSYLRGVYVEGVTISDDPTNERSVLTPALAPGVYPFAASGTVDGVLVAR